MAVETATELAIFFETDDFAVNATYSPVGGSSVIIKGIFDNEFYEADAGGSVTFAIEQPRFTCTSSDVASAVEGDGIVISGVSYTINVVQRDGTGVTTLVLEKV
jgi:hypothetical protein